MERTIAGNESAPLVWLAKGHVPCLDGLRAVSILLVLVAHLASTQNSPIPQRYWHYTSWGSKCGVTMFFVISGFIITLLLLRERAATQDTSIKGFYFRRILRIVPAYGAFLLGIGIFTFFGVFDLSADGFLKAATYTTSIFPCNDWEVGHTWSLSVEEHFYFVWPLVFCFFPSRSFLFAAIYLLSVPLLRFAIYLYDAEVAGRMGYFTPTRMDSIAFGSCLAFLLWNYRFPRRELSMAVFLGLIISCAIGLAGNWYCMSQSSIYQATLFHSVNPLLFSMLIWTCVCGHRTLLGWLLNTRIAMTIGVLSYSLYLWQNPFLNAASERWYCAWPVNICFAVAAAVASYLLIERPVLYARDRFAVIAPAEKHEAADASSAF